MGIILFLIILLVLVISHEFGHFIVAKLFKIRVDEFAFGFPPRIFAKKFGETQYAFNALPLGGYVKIYGENPNDVHDEDRGRSFGAQARWKQASVIVAGVVFNLLLAWILLSMIFLIGAPMLKDNDQGYVVSNPRLTVTGVAPQGPAELAGIKEGDIIVSLGEGGAIKEVTSGDEVQSFIGLREGKEIILTVERERGLVSLPVVPSASIVPGKIAIGIYMDQVGVVKLPIIEALTQGAKRTWQYTVLTADGIFTFLSTAIVGKSDFTQVTGPVGIVNAVGNAAEHGYTNVILFTALISINLAIINLIPFPALDGGRLLFVLIESVIRKPIPVRIANLMNVSGFALLMLLMLLVTYHDIVRLFS